MSVDDGPWTTVRSQDLTPHRRSPWLFRAVSTFELLGQLVAAIWILIAFVWVVRQSSLPFSAGP
jgi:hypothetical protein